METNNRQSGVSPAKAVLLGALAPGVNGPTWITLKSAFLMLGFSHRLAWFQWNIKCKNWTWCQMIEGDKPKKNTPFFVCFCN
uniref:Uncharacterized protein MANES_17G046800 n=1 Tax=Rhizophora mucronata TaxID=61149 RepID=A0A2P2JF62_RHIMU